MNDVPLSHMALAVAITFAVGYVVGRYRHETIWRDRDGTVLRETTLQGEK